MKQVHFLTKMILINSVFGLLLIIIGKQYNEEVPSWLFLLFGILSGVYCASEKDD